MNPRARGPPRSQGELRPPLTCKTTALANPIQISTNEARLPHRRPGFAFTARQCANTAGPQHNDPRRSS